MPQCGQSSTWRSAESHPDVRAEIERALEAAYEQDAPPDRAIDVYLSALQPYVEALGERLEINAVFPDETITLRVSGDEDRVPTAPSVRSA